MPLAIGSGQNRFMQGEPTGGAPQQPMPQMSGMPMGGAPMPAPQAPDPKQIEMARVHLREEFAGLRSLVEKPTLTKKDIFSAVSDMIAKGAFPDRSSKQNLVAEMAKLPDDEMGLRKAVGARLLQVSTMIDQLHAIHGPGE
jgi:hypothetical protein